MRSSLLVRLFGFPATLIHGDPLVLDRWFWLRKRLIRGAGNTLDVGCGSGAFAIGAARFGNSCIGLSWDEGNNKVAAERAEICHAKGASFETFDVRNLDKRKDLYSRFDQVICCEVIEHLQDDAKLIRDMARCLKKDGLLFLTAPNKYLRPIYPNDRGPFPLVENGEHMRVGYTHEELTTLCKKAGLQVIEKEYLSGVLCQSIARIRYFLMNKTHPLFGWVAILPLRWIPLAFDGWVHQAINYPYYGVAVVAEKRGGVPMSS